jgi:hypothetical protein
LASLIRVYKFLRHGTKNPLAIHFAIM